MRSRVFFLAIWLAALDLASAGSVQTLDGRRWTGDLQLATGGIVVASSNATETIALTNLLSAEFLTPETEQPGGAGSGNGLLGFYFANTNQSGAPFVRLDESIQFNWPAGDAAPGIPVANFSVIWTGEVEAPVSGEFRFTLAADDFATLQIADQPVASVSNNRDGGEVTSAPLLLEAGKRVPLKLVFANAAGAARAQLLWTGLGISKRFIPRSRLYAKSQLPDRAGKISGTSGLIGTYYARADFSGASHTRIDPTVNFSWNDRDPLPGFGRTNLAIRWTGQVKVDHSEEYTFYVTADERVRLWIDGQPLVSRADQLWLSESKGSLPLVAGERYDVRLECTSTSGDAVAKLWWSSGSTAKTNIPATHLFPSAPPAGYSVQSGPDAKSPPGILFRNGTFVACGIERGTETSLRATGWLKTSPVTTLNVARLVFQPLSKGMESRLQSARPGVLLAKGDFVDGDFRGFDGQRVRLNSILFGTRQYDVRKEAVAVVLRDVAASPAQLEIWLRDGSVLKPTSIRSQAGELAVQDAAAGALKIPAGDVATMQRRSAGPIRK
jgi:hypothetical protein